MTKSKKRQTKRIQRGGGNYEYSIDGRNWMDARPYQEEAVTTASASPLTLYKYNKNGYVFDLVPLKNLVGTNSFAMIKENGSIAFLREMGRAISIVNMSQTKKSSSNSSTTVKKFKASADFTVDYLGKAIQIKQGNYYYAKKPKEAIIGWHGSKNPPADMDGNGLYNIDNANALLDS
jgi:hypothetical protein